MKNLRGVLGSERKLDIKGSNGVGGVVVWGGNLRKEEMLGHLKAQVVGQSGMTETSTSGPVRDREIGWRRVECYVRGGKHKREGKS